jgi:hypothetical protein
MAVPSLDIEKGSEVEGRAALAPVGTVAKTAGQQPAQWTPQSGRWATPVQPRRSGVLAALVAAWRAMRVSTLISGDDRASSTPAV